MSNILKSEDFGLKLYNKFPPAYRKDDEDVGYVLKRYLEALSEGGFKNVIEELNGILYSVDSSNVRADLLPVLFKHYGLEIFNGIPEEYLRYLLPKLGGAWSKKGSLSVVEFITSSLTGIRTTSYLDVEEEDKINVKLEMDFSLGDYFPEATQLSRLLGNFMPFYCELELIYSYLFRDAGSIHGEESYNYFDIIRKEQDESSLLDTKVTDNLVVRGVGDENISVSVPSDNSCLNRISNTLNNGFCTNALYSYDILHRDGSLEIVY